MSAVPTTTAPRPEHCQKDSFHQEVADVVHTLEHLAARAAYAQEPCAQILLRTAELLRIVVVKH